MKKLFFETGLELEAWNCLEFWVAVIWRHDYRLRPIYSFLNYLPTDLFQELHWHGKNSMICIRKKWISIDIGIQ